MDLGTALNVGWDHLGAPPDAFVGINPAPPAFADRETVADLLFVDAGTLAIDNVWFIPGRSLTVVYSSGAERFVVDYGGTVSVRTLGGDTALTALPALLDPLRAGERAGGQVTVQILSYLPGERCAVRYRGEGIDLVAKIARGEDMHACDRRQRSLFELPGRRFAMAEPLGVDAEGIRLERAVPGRRAEELMPEVSPAGLLSAISAALPCLHAAPTAGRLANGSSEVIARMQDKVVPKIALALPRLALRLDTVCSALSATRPSDGSPVAIHGDLHTANVLFDDALQPAFIDLDSLAVGDAEYDLALFASRLILHGLLTGTPTLIPAEYGAERPDRFRWYLAATLLGRQMKTCVRHLAPGAARYCELLLAEAEALCL